MSVAVITGAGQGIGRAIALGFSMRDTCVVVADVHVANARKVQDEIENTGKKALAVEVDVSSEPSVTRLIKRTLEEFGTIDVLVNDAGIYPGSPIEKMTHELTHVREGQTGGDKDSHYPKFYLTQLAMLLEARRAQLDSDRLYDIFSRRFAELTDTTVPSWENAIH